MKETGVTPFSKVSASEQGLAGGVLKGGLWASLIASVTITLLLVGVIE